MHRIELEKWLIHIILPTITAVSMSGMDTDFQRHTLLVSAPCSLTTYHTAWCKKETMSQTLDTNSISIQLITLEAFLAHRYNSFIYFTQDVYSSSLIQCSCRFFLLLLYRITCSVCLLFWDVPESHICLLLLFQDM